MNDFVVKNGLQLGGSVKGSVGTVTGNATLDLSTGSAFEVVPTADVTFAFSNPPAAGNAQSFNLALTGVLIDNAYDLANASYDGVSFSVAAQETNSRGLFFKPDGTKMYVLGATGIDINEYNLSTAWDISTASYVQNFSVATQEASPTDLFFKTDGTKVYVVGSSGDDVNEYGLSTAWDISTASYVQSFSVATEEAEVAGLFFKPDGTKMYITGSGGQDINEYSLSTAWDISTASYVQRFFSGVQEALPTGLSFKSDGTKMYLVGVFGDDVSEYGLSTAWDISTASFVRVFSFASEETTAHGLFFGDNGTKLYIVGTGSNAVHQYSTGTFGPTTITYPASVKWPSGTTPTAPADGETDLLTFYTDDGGVSYYGIQRGDNMAPVPPEPMVLIYDTTLSTGTTVLFSLAGTVDVTVDWGDGSVETFTTAGNKSHTYATEGTYTVEMTGTLTGFGGTTLLHKEKLTRVTSWGELEFTLTSLANGFRGCSNLTEVPTTLPSGVTNMSSMFILASSFNQNIGSWDVANVTSMSSMFQSATAFNQNIGYWNVANVTNMGSMFQSASAFNNGGSADINNWVTSSVTNMGSMFQSASAFNQNIGSWNVANVTAMNTMFFAASAFNQNIGSWNVAKVTNMGNVFNGATAMTFPLGSWQTNLAGQPSSFSAAANATFVGFRGTANFPLLADTVTRINT